MTTGHRTVIRPAPATDTPDGSALNGIQLGRTDSADPADDLSRERIKRRPVLGCLFNEYERAA